MNKNVESGSNQKCVDILGAIRNEMQEYDFNYKVKPSKTKEIRLIIKTFISVVLKLRNTRIHHRLDNTDQAVAVFINDIMDKIHGEKTLPDGTFTTGEVFILTQIDAFVNYRGTEACIDSYCNILKTIFKMLGIMDNYTEYSLLMSESSPKQALLLTTLLFELEHVCFMIRNTSFEIKNNNFSLSSFESEPDEVRGIKRTLTSELTLSALNCIDRIKTSDVSIKEKEDLGDSIESVMHTAMDRTDSCILNYARLINTQYTEYSENDEFYTALASIAIQKDYYEYDPITMTDIFSALITALVATPTEIEHDIINSVCNEFPMMNIVSKLKKTNKAEPKKEEKPEKKETKPEDDQQKCADRGSLSFPSVEQFWETFSDSDMYKAIVSDFYTAVKSLTNSADEKDLLEKYIADNVCKLMNSRVIIKLKNDNALLADMVNIYKTYTEDEAVNKRPRPLPEVSSIPRSRLTKLLAIMGACAASVNANTEKLAEIDEYYNAVFAELNNEPDKASVFHTGIDIMTRQLCRYLDKLLNMPVFTRPAGSGTRIRDIDDIIGEICHTNTSVRPSVQPSPNPTIISGPSSGEWIFKNGKLTRLI